MPGRPGTYLLVLASGVDRPLRIGRLGNKRVSRGFYVYVGSAFGPGGINARVRHHEKVSIRRHWHVDFLRAVTGLAAVWYSHDSGRKEHQWARRLAGMKGMSTPIPGFGSSDCDCSAHLCYSRNFPSRRRFERRLGVRLHERRTERWKRTGAAVA
jgi:Uri superfamily endonuclease